MSAPDPLEAKPYEVHSLGLRSSDLGCGQPQTCSWLICEHGQRFVDVVNRFAPAMTPIGAVASTHSVEIADCEDQLELMIRSGSPSVILWSIRREDILMVLDQAIALASHPTQILTRCILPIVACDRFGPSGELALAETGISVFLRHPEDLPKFAPLIEAHFASFASGLK